MKHKAEEVEDLVLAAQYRVNLPCRACYLLGCPAIVLITGLLICLGRLDMLLDGVCLGVHPGEQVRELVTPYPLLRHQRPEFPAEVIAKAAQLAREPVLKVTPPALTGGEGVV